MCGKYIRKKKIPRKAETHESSVWGCGSFRDALVKRRSAEHKNASFGPAVGRAMYILPCFVILL